MGFDYFGYIEFIGVLCGENVKLVMMLMIVEFKVVLVIVYIVVKEIYKKLLLWIIVDVCCMIV